MSQIIAGIYEIKDKIGAGGGGVVYMGWHLRLQKPVVLKADRRTLNAGMETLRREVDLLKGLRHTYIPQVYDFVQQDGVVYTVMDFIEGESCDKLVGRGMLPPQAEVIKWACQLLEALSYLHSQPPHGILHGDIKPANIMVRPNGDICLIDYNIALALGEDGAVKVGFSRGYASPEHYGSDYIQGNRQAAVHRFSGLKSSEGREDDKTETLPENRLHLSGKSATGSGRGILLDVRSDIYSLGATLYYMLSGHRPAESAFEVEPLTEEICSPAVSEIIKKAMAPEPDKRYQSAEEMRAAFMQLYQKDERSIRYRRQIRVLTVSLLALFLGGAFCSFVGLKQLEQIQRAFALAEYSADSLGKGNVADAVSLAMQAIPSGKSIFDAPITAQARKALTDALGVYDLKDGFKRCGVITLPAEPFDIALSPFGTYLAAVYAYEAAVYETENGRRVAAFPIQESALSDVVFTDETHIVYAGSRGVTAYDLKKKEEMWTGDVATTLAVSADGRVIAAVDRDDGGAVVYRVSDGEKLAEVSFDGRHMSVAVNAIFADPQKDIFALNEDGSFLGVSFDNGGICIFDINHAGKTMELYEQSDLRNFSGGFCGKYFAFTAQGTGEAVLGLADVERGVYLGEDTSADRFHLQADSRGLFLAKGNLLVCLQPDTMEERELAYAEGAAITNFSVGEEYVLTATDDPAFSFYDSGAHLTWTEAVEEPCDFLSLAGKYAVIGNRNEPSVRVMKLEGHEEAKLLSYDASYEHDEARISLDQKTAMLFSCQGFRIYDRMGNCLVEKALPDAEAVYDQQFIRTEEGSFLETIWYDGTVRRYSAADGSLLSETKKEAPRRDLYEEFAIDGYRIASSLHEAPKVYDSKTDKLVAVLEEDSYLTYVTQTGEYIMTEYISASGERYGLLLDHSFQKLAYLPGICDIVEDTLIFDYGSGVLKQCKLYSMEELIALGENAAAFSVQE